MPGTSNNALIKHIVIEITIRALKKRSGAKFENAKAVNPTITEPALNIMPRPAVDRAIRTDSL